MEEMSWIVTPLANRKRIARTGAEARAESCVYPAPENSILFPARAVYSLLKFLRVISNVNVTKRSKSGLIGGFFALILHWKMFFCQSGFGLFRDNKIVYSLMWWAHAFT